jgi:hypothetical protein
MRILSLHAPLFAAGWRDAHDVVAWGLDPACDVHPDRAVTPLADVLAALPAGWRPDRIVIGDDGRLLRVVGLEHAPCPTALVSLDPRAAGWHAPLAAAVDVAFVAQRAALARFRAAGADAVWLPHWAPDDPPEPAPQKQHAFSFVGSLDPAAKPGRTAFFAALRARQLPLHAVEGRFADVYPRSTVVVDHAEHGELTARVFEAMACGALVLAPSADNGLLDLFQDGEHLLTYPAGDVEGVLAALVRRAGSPAALAAIAERGRETVLERHRATHRAATVLDALDRVEPRRRRRSSAAAAYEALAAEAQRLAARHPASPLHRRLRAGYSQALALRAGASASARRATAVEDPADVGGARP